MMSMHNSTHSSQMKTVGPAMSLRTSCWLLPQKEQYSVLLESPLPTLLMANLQLIGSRATAARPSAQIIGRQLRNSSVPSFRTSRKQSPGRHRNPGGSGTMIDDANMVPPRDQESPPFPRGTVARTGEVAGPRRWPV